jgi:predicted MFS family arabinose efflux permease
MSGPDVPADKIASTIPVSASGHRYALGLLLGASTLSAVDRQILNVLVEPIRQDLQLSDTQIGLMTGLAFALFYATMALPLARLAERMRRPLLLGACMALWSVFTMVCGAAQSFVQLFVARVLVGVGEAGSGPASHALVTDITPPEKRARALALIGSGQPLGALIGLACGGIAADAFGWRWAFVLAGVPGLLLALLIFFTLRDPRPAAGIGDAIPSAREALAVLRRKVSFWMFVAGSSLVSTTALAFGAFFGSLLIRNHGAELEALAAGFGQGFGTTSVVGAMLALAFGAAGALGVILGGALADRLRARDPAAYLGVPALASLASTPCFVAAALVTTPLAALAFLSLAVVISNFAMAPVLAGAQSIVPVRMRATTSAVLFLIVNFVALGIGPLGVGVLSDAMGGTDGLQTALAWSALGGPLAAIAFWAGRAALVRDLEG